MTPDDARAWLDAHVNLESLGVPAGTTRRATRPTLERMAALAALLGSPQLAYPVVHVTGTNGKTSVARLAGALLVEAGLSVGSYTSPHLERVNERVAWNGHPIDDSTLDELLRLIATIEAHLPDTPSFFEILTGVAFRWFADVAVDAAVVEVGLGGRWDATNVADGRVAVVTNVTIDHVEYLGPTRLDIAREKAGIVKPDSTLILGETDPTAQGPFLDRGATRVLRRDADFGVHANRVAHGGRLLDVYTPAARYEDLFLSLHGAHQADNAAAALAAAEALLERPLDPDLVAAVCGRAQVPGRLEVVGHAPLVLLDGAHNVAGAHALREALAEEFPAAARTLVVGVLQPKDPAEMLEALGVAEADRVVVCEAPSPRAHPAVDVAEAARGLGLPADRVEAIPDVGQALERAQALTPADGQVVVTGSLYTAGAARAAVRRQTPAGLPAQRVRIGSRPVSTRTLFLCKPDAVERGLVGEIVGRMERKGLRIVALDQRRIHRTLAEQHYDEHRGKPFFDDLVAFITRGPLVAMVLDGGPDTWAVVRRLMGATDPRQADPGTIRGDLALETGENLVHGSDGPEAAAREIALFFPQLTDGDAPPGA